MWLSLGTRTKSKKKITQIWKVELKKKFSLPQWSIKKQLNAVIQRAAENPTWRHLTEPKLLYLMVTSVFLLFFWFFFFFLGEILNAVVNFRTTPEGENGTEMEQVTPTEERKA